MAGLTTSLPRRGKGWLIAGAVLCTVIGSLTSAVGQAPSEWDRTLGEGKSGAAFAVATTSDRGYVVAGRIIPDGANAPDAWIAKLDGSGTTQWEHRFGGKDIDQANAVAATADGGYLLAGSTHSKGKGAGDGWLLKLDGKGKVEWEKLFGGKKDDALTAIALVPGSGYLVAGNTQSKSTSQDGWLIKVDASGRSLWERTVGAKPIDGFNAVIPDGAGGYLLAGEQADPKAGKGNAWLVKVDAAGGKVWEKPVADGAESAFRSLATAPGGGFVVAGWATDASGNDHDAQMLRIDADGNVVWKRRYGGSKVDQGYAVVTLSDGRLMLAGMTHPDDKSASDAWALWTNGEGERVGERRFGGKGAQRGLALVGAADGGFVLAGTTASAPKGEPTKPRIYRFEAQSVTAGSGPQLDAGSDRGGIPWYWFAAATALLFAIALAVALFLTRRSRPITRPTEQLDMSVISERASSLPASQRPAAAASGANGWRLECGDRDEPEFVFEFSSLDLARAGDGLVLGRNPDLCDMTVGNSSVSRRHVRFTLLDGAIQIEDLNTTNGTYLAGQRMPPMRPTPVHDGDTLLLGDFTLIFKTIV